ncbi:fibrinogen gamma chain-like [Musca vetustissima]|uniref:fibrinogen gamma chain-like n=1 Tax=Musca vetustissima TaxID=27455 RepID=UPI002AB743F6|nr:fibrinogen gamma chain-like [Musca vetustissima]
MLEESQLNLTLCLNGNPQINGILEKIQKLEAKVKEIRKQDQKPTDDIVVQRRMDGSEDFFRPWAEYKQGFGNSSGEFFIGLDKLNNLTNSRPYELLIRIEDWDDDCRFARYDQFIIGTETEKYILKELGRYSGSAGDALSYSLGQKFTTKDQGNDHCSKNCAVEFTGAWWYKSGHRGYAHISALANSLQKENLIISDIHGKLNELGQSLLSKQQSLEETQQNLTQCLNENPQINGILEKIHKLETSLKELRENIKKPGDIVIQRRIDGSENFFRPWADYKEGFGNSSAEFFIGLDKLNKLTNTRPYELLIVMEDWENDRRYARYDQFIIGTETEKYILKELGKYTGSAGDSLSYSLGQKFSTKDQDNDVWSKNCAVEFTGAWWFKDCHRSNLNGRYIKGGKTTVFAQGVNWDPFKGFYYSLKIVEMILRPT